MFKLTQKTVKNRLLGVALITVFLGVLFLSLFNMSMNMDMSGNTSGCPFMTPEVALCSNVLDHIGAWKSAFLTTIPGFSLFLSILIATLVLSTVAPNLVFKQTYKAHFLSREFLQRIYSFSYRRLQELFSSGILHPKLYNSFIS